MVAAAGSVGLALERRGVRHGGQDCLFLAAAAAAALAQTLSEPIEGLSVPALEVAWSRAADEGEWGTGLPVSRWAPVPSRPLDLVGARMDKDGQSVAGLPALSALLELAAADEAALEEWLRPRLRDNAVTVPFEPPPSATA